MKNKAILLLLIIGFFISGCSKMEALSGLYSAALFAKEFNKEWNARESSKSSYGSTIGSDTEDSESDSSESEDSDVTYESYE